jgi:hypothetical protein
LVYSQSQFSLVELTLVSVTGFTQLPSAELPIPALNGRAPYSRGDSGIISGELETESAIEGKNPWISGLHRGVGINIGIENASFFREDVARFVSCMLRRVKREEAWLTLDGHDLLTDR